MPIYLLPAAESIIKAKQKSLRENLEQRLQAAKEAFEHKAFDDISGDGLARHVRSDIEADVTLMQSEDMSSITPDKVSTIWLETVSGAQDRILGAEEDVICKIAGGNISIPEAEHIARFSSAKFWGTTVVRELSYASSAVSITMLDLMQSHLRRSFMPFAVTFDHSGISISLTEHEPIGSFDANSSLSIDLEEAALAMTGWRHQTGTKSFASFHGTYNFSPDTAISTPSSMSDFDFIEASLLKVHPEATCFELRVLSAEDEQRPGDIISYSGGPLGFLTGYNTYLGAATDLSHNDGFGTMEIDDFASTCDIYRPVAITDAPLDAYASKIRFSY